MASHVQGFIRPFRNNRIITHSPFYYGWVIWMVALFGIIASAPGQSFTISLFLDYYIVDFFSEVRPGHGTVVSLYGSGSFFDHIHSSSQGGRTAVSALFGLGTFLAALGLTWVGKSVDRFGNRRVGLMVALAFAAVLMALSLTTGLVTLLIGFIAIRLLGMGAMFLVSSTAIAQWWRVKRGWVIGLALVGFALFQRVYLPWLQQLIESIGWRSTWIILGLIVGVVVVPLWWVLMRDRPEDFGLLPDNMKPTHNEANPDAEKAEDTEENWSLPQARRTPIFWIFIVGRVFPAAIGTGMIIHQVSMFQEIGHSAATAATTYGSLAIVTAIVTLISGRFISRIRPGYVMALQLSMLIVAIYLSMVMTQPWMLTLYAVAFGFVMGLGGTFDGSVWVDLFGRQHQGAIRGFTSTIFVTGTALGPVLFGLSHDLLGSYDPIRWLTISLTLIPLTLSLMVKRPRPLMSLPVPDTTSAI